MRPITLQSVRSRILTVALSTWMSAVAGTAAAATTTTSSEAALPLTEVILYSSGVGYFHRGGEVTGDATVDLRFKVEDINDLLKSMVVQDHGGGKVGSVTYGSRDPVTKTLKTFSVDLTENPSFGQLLNQMRGERVELEWPGKLAGVLLGVEKKNQPAADNRVIQTEHLNILTDNGLQSVPLASIQRLALTNPRLNEELRQALGVLASSHDTQKKIVSIRFTGQGPRKVSIAYIAQTPVWKTSYRLVIDEKEPFLQGWAIVENTTDEDWKDVRLSMVSGRPISFVMDLYQPLYSHRPVVKPEIDLALGPQVHADAVEGKVGETLGRMNADASARHMERAALANAPQAAKAGGRVLAEAAPEPAIAENSFRFGVAALSSAGVAAAAEGTRTGELFKYALNAPVSISRQNSAMLPIVNQGVQGQKIALYNPATHARHPLNAFRLKNTTALHLMQGPITVFDGNTYAGDAKIEDLAPGQDRLISYALDLNLEVDSNNGSGSEEITSIRLVKGMLVSSRRRVEERTYTLRNRDTKGKTVLVEHPLRPDWTLLDPKEPAERTRDALRFKVNVPDTKPVTLVVREESVLQESMEVASFAPDTFVYFINQRKISPKVKQALLKVSDLHQRQQLTAAERSRREQRIGEITSEQTRIRENMARLAQSSELYGRYMKKLDQQETDLEALRQEIEKLRTEEKARALELTEFLAQLEID